MRIRSALAAGILLGALPLLPTAADAQTPAPRPAAPAARPAPAPAAPMAAPVTTADPEANRRASANYEAAVKANPNFRRSREHEECDAIESLDLRAQCIASFDALPAAKAPPRPAGDLMHPTVTIQSSPVRSPGDN